MCMSQELRKELSWSDQESQLNALLKQCFCTHYILLFVIPLHFSTVPSVVPEPKKKKLNIFWFMSLFLCVGFFMGCCWLGFFLFVFVCLFCFYQMRFREHYLTTVPFFFVCFVFSSSRIKLNNFYLFCRIRLL